MRSSVIMTLMIMTYLTTGANAQTKWIKYEGNPVLEGDPLGSGSWDEGDIGGPEIIFDGVTYHMWYGGPRPQCIIKLAHRVCYLSRWLHLDKA